jgi:hypothetical protein
MKGIDSWVAGHSFSVRWIWRDMFLGRRKRNPGDAWVERSRRARLLRTAIQMRDSGALSEEEFDTLTSRILAGLSVPEVPDPASETSDKRG